MGVDVVVGVLSGLAAGGAATGADSGGFGAGVEGAGTPCEVRTTTVVVAGAGVDSFVSVSGGTI
jgi:hypothetical protein